MNAILIVDDHAILRSGLVRMLKAGIPDSTLGEARDADEALRAVMERDWDLLILDIGLPGRSGLDVLEEVRKLKPKLPVLVLTGISDVSVAIRVFECGAMGYLCKDCSEDNLLEAVRKIMDGGRYLTLSLADKLVNNLTRQPPRQSQSNTPVPAIRGRMLDVLLRMGKGDPVKAIAQDMGLSIKTVSTYRTRILQRLHLKSNADIVRYCLLHHLTE